LNLIHSFELLFFAVFGQTSTDQTIADKIATPQETTQPKWTEVLFKLVFGVYLLVSVIVLINLLIAMMSDTYQRIQVFKISFFLLGEIFRFKREFRNNLI
jgi:ABC-type phosphate transport system permease subunit